MSYRAERRIFRGLEVVDGHRRVDFQSPVTFDMALFPAGDREIAPTGIHGSIILNPRPAG